MSQVKKEGVMCRRKFDLAVLCGFFCIMLVFLFTAISYAECVGGDICVNNPGTGDELVSGHVSYVELAINPTAPRFATQYRLYLCCCLGSSCTPTCTNEEWGKRIITLQMCDPNASRFSYKLGEPTSGCPETYLWEVPFVQEEATCKLAAVLLDANVNPLVTAGHVIDTDVSEDFKIKPFGTPVAALDLSPVSKTVGPGGPSGLAIGKANYQISGGVPPFRVAVYVGTYPPPPAINNYITINGNPVYPPQTFAGPLVFTLTNKVSEPCTDTTVTIAVRDSALPTPSTVFASYVINCLPY
jgi:hypothetical protein